jgi:predicted 3-demethylubiquinone-9 3-methyltransferase (glyoxalase superfamily)
MFVGDVCGKAEEAINFYVSVFKNAPGSKAADANAGVLSRYGKGENPDKEGSVRYARFSLLGQEFGAMDSAREHKFRFNEAISFIVPCDTQQEIDYVGGSCRRTRKQNNAAGSRTKYGLSWQITPTVIRELLSGNDKARIKQVTQAFLKMKKFDVAEIKRSAAG